MKIAIVGAGMMGHVLAWRLRAAGYSINVFDKGHSLSENNSAANAAAGMLAPYSEMDSADSVIFNLGIAALPLWKNISTALVDSTEIDIDFRQSGSLIVAHHQDQSDLVHYQQALQKNVPETQQHALRVLDKPSLATIEKTLADRFNQAIFIKDEACLSPIACLSAINQYLRKHGTTFHYGVDIQHVSKNCLAHYGQFDQIIDCRGLGAKPNLNNLRGVRGESILLNAPDVKLKTIVRLTHPRYKLYISPRKNNQYLIGATQIESNDNSPISVRSTLELLSAAYSIDENFSEAALIGTQTACRPTMPDNSPTVFFDDNILRINGLYRHGVLISPAIAELVLNLIEDGTYTDKDSNNILPSMLNRYQLTNVKNGEQSTRLTA